MESALDPASLGLRGRSMILRPSVAKNPFNGSTRIADRHSSLVASPLRHWAALASLPQHSGRSGKLDRSHPPPRA